jgi:BirA family biotin operon repressor/biotin-[acetyl-CoA-carboxylase] ligase
LKTIEKTQAILNILADGEFHSGQSIAKALKVSRSAVWKLIKQIKSWQVDVYSITGKGYKIPGGLELIDAGFLQSGIEQKTHLLKQVEVFTSLDSTAEYLAREWKKQSSHEQGSGFARVCIAEHQTAGRGRKGRSWSSPFGANLYFSIGFQLPLGLTALGGLSLAVGMSLCETLNQLSNELIKIKWPNDLLVNNQKMAGILVEASGDTNDTSFLNIGIGLNWNMQSSQAESIEQNWVNLKPLLLKKLSRSEVLLAVLCDLDKAIQSYLEDGFTRFMPNWPALSAFYKKPVILHLPNEKLEGVEVGIETNGALRLQTQQGIKIFHSGEVSLRGLPTSDLVNPNSAKGRLY